MLDEERAPIVKQMFRRVGEQGHSGRTLKKWLDTIGFTTKNDKALCLGRIYGTLNNPFYYGDFEYHGIIYKGRHPPLITKQLWEKTQLQLTVPPKTWHKKVFPFKTICKCGSCGASVTAEEKYKKLKYGGYTKHIYYHCARSIDYDCEEPYITEEDLIQQLIAKINQIKIDEKLITKKLRADIDKFHALRSKVLHQEYLAGNLNQFDYPKEDPVSKDIAKDYLLHVLKAGTAEERQQILSVIKTKFILHNRRLMLR
ncbi:recombinase family protein [Deltaproteobacteria bacterium TL4]